MSAALDVYDRVWTPADLADLPEELDWRRVEIVDGLLIVSPQPSRRHVWIADRIYAVLVRAAPANVHITQTMPIVLGRTYRVPDVTVVVPSDEAGDELSPSEVLLVVEVESPASITTDRITKPAQYAAAGIPYFWRVETDPMRLVAHELADGRYVEVGSWGVGETARLADPVSLEIEVAALVP